MTALGVGRPNGPEPWCIGFGYSPLGVIHDRGGPSHKFMSVRFAPKATVADQNVIRRFVPYRNSDG
jgi:hypothetical protein